MLIQCLRHKNLQHFSHTSELIKFLALQSIYFTIFDLLMYPYLIQADIWVKVHLAIFNILQTLPSTQVSYGTFFSFIFSYFKAVVHGKSGYKTSK
jgi:hypothetical protein